MSDPVTLAAMKAAFTAVSSYGAAISAGLSVATTAVSFKAQEANAKGVENANKAANERARQYMIEDQDSLTRMSAQETAGASQKINQNQIDAAKAGASAKVAATAGGVSGLSVDSLLGDIFGQEASIRDSVNQNLENTGEQIQQERNSVQRGFQNTINTRPQPNHPSLLGATLEAGTGVMGAYKDQWKIRGQTGS